MNEFSLQHDKTNHPRRSSAPRGRIIVVTENDDHLLKEIAGATNRPIKAVANFYEAMGELATTDLRTAPDAVIARSGTFADRAGEFTGALRKIDPSITVLAIGSQTRDEDQLLSPFVDGILEPPVSRLEFERAIQAAGAVRTGPQPTDPSPSGKSIETPATPQHKPSEIEVPDLDNNQELAIDENKSQNEADSLTPTPSQNTEQHDSVTHSRDNTIDDGDLIDRVLHDPGSVTALLELAVMSRINEPATVTITDDPNHILNENATPIMYEGQCLGSLSIEGKSDDQQSRWAKWVAPWLALARQTETWRRQAYTDDLTGAGNRRYFDAIFRETLKLGLHKRECVTLLIFDIDDFKHFNDSFGHSAGDEILIETIRLLKSVIRPKDVVCRVGGDEFAVIFYDASGERQPGSKHPENIARITERFQQKIAQHQFPKLGPEAPGRLTISGGLATFPWDGHDAESLYERADQALLAAKRSGKNAIILGPGT